MEFWLEMPINKNKIKHERKLKIINLISYQKYFSIKFKQNILDPSSNILIGPYFIIPIICGMFVFCLYK